MTIPQALQIAVQHHQAGRLAEAEALYRQILAAQPNHADALHLLGVIAHQVGRHDLAVEWIRKAIAANPAAYEYHVHLGNAHAARGHLDEAIDSFRRALQLNADFPAGYNNLGAALRDQGRLDEAIAACRHALRLKPDFPEAYNNLGNALRDIGQPDEAIAAYRHATEFKSDFAQAHTNLGNALKNQGRLDEAIAAYRRALELQPGDPEAHNHLGAALAGQGSLDEATEAFRRALQLKPDYSEARNNVGNALRDRGQLDEAIAEYHHALKSKPDFPEVHNNLGIAFRKKGQIDDAAAAYRRALELKPDYAEAHNNLGLALKEQGQLDDAIAAYRRGIELQPDFPEAHSNLGIALAARNRPDEAIAAYCRALELRPDYPEVLNNLGAALARRVQFDEAIAAYRRALELQPDYLEALNNLGAALAGQSQLDDAIAAYRGALQIEPDSPGIHSNLICALHLHPGHDAGTISEEHQRWNRQFSEPLKPYLQPHANDRGAQRLLRIGYVSPDFLDHAVARFALPLFECHNRESFEILCYSGVVLPDPTTERFRALAGNWRNTVGLSDAGMAEMIRGDKVDILVDLAMHTGANRLPVFARQPAPVQVAWLAYPGSTGVNGMGYRLTDAHMDPPGERPPWSAEEPVRLPDCWCCYQPVEESPAVNALPAWSGEGVTFGSLNNFAKVNESVLTLWARVLAAVKGSRLLLFCPEGRTRERVRAFFGARGIEARRIEFVGFLPRGNYLGLYQRIDLGLDPFPYNGMTTTCDALWMGTPVLTLPGALPTARAGLSLLSSIGLPELAAASEEDYVRLAVELAGNLPRLADLRAALRPRMQASPLVDAPRFARNVEAAYRRMWQAWRPGQ